MFQYSNILSSFNNLEITFYIYSCLNKLKNCRIQLKLNLNMILFLNLGEISWFRLSSVSNVPKLLPTFRRLLKPQSHDSKIIHKNIEFETWIGNKELKWYLMEYWQRIFAKNTIVFYFFWFLLFHLTLIA